MPGRLSDIDGCKRELQRCHAIYKTVEQSSPFVVAVHRAIEKHFRKKPLEPLPPFDDAARATAEAAVRAGTPLGLCPPLETKRFVGLFKQAAKAMTESSSAFKGTVKEVRNSTDRWSEEIGETVDVAQALAFRQALVRDRLLENDLATFLFTLTLGSFYRQLLAAQRESVRVDLWDGGCCPTCGTKPHFGLLRSTDNTTQLECWLCGTEWAFTRLLCPFCANDDMEKLGFFTAENSTACRVKFCRACSQYYKVFDLRQFDESGGIDLNIHNLATLSYDVLARREGFSPGSGLVWVNDPD